MGRRYNIYCEVLLLLLLSMQLLADDAHVRSFIQYSLLGQAGLEAASFLIPSFLAAAALFSLSLTHRLCRHNRF